MEADLSQALCYLVSGKGNNFYARVITALQIRRSKEFPYMAVALEGRYIVLLYNPDWIEKAEFDDVVATTEHEALHVVLEHIPRKLQLAATYQKEDERKRFMLVTPFAEDMADNCLLVKSNDWVQQNPKGWVWPDEKPFDLPRDKTYEWYVKKLMEKDEQSEESGKQKEQGNDDGGDGGAFHKFLEANSPNSSGGKYKLIVNHKDWEKLLNNLSDEEKEGLSNELKMKIQGLVKKAVDDHHKARGTLPAFLQELIEKLLEPPIVPWTQILRDKVINTKRWKWKRSIARPNRRKVGVMEELRKRQRNKDDEELLTFLRGINPPSPFPGRSKDKTFTCAFCIDTSGSMGERELQIALSELQHLQKADKDIEITIIEADVSIGKEYTITSTSELNYQLTGRGGTDFNFALKRARELKPDICFYYTDGYAPAPDPENRVACPMVWLISPRGTIPDENWGYILEMRDKFEGEVRL